MPDLTRSTHSSRSTGSADSANRGRSLGPSGLPATDAAQRLLELLLNRYEASKAFADGEATARRVQVALTDSVLPGYVNGGMDPYERTAMHETLMAWAKRRIVALEWVRFEVNNLLRRVYLEWDGIPLAYELLGRAPKLDELAGVKAELEQLRSRLNQTPVNWVQTWLADVLSTIQDKKMLPQNLIPADAEKRRWLLQSIAGLLDKGEEELPMRLFSKRYLKSSKLFEQHVRSRLVTLLRTYRPLRDEFVLEDEQLLAEVGIEMTHEEVSFCGPLSFRMEGGEVIDLRSFPMGLSLDTEVFRRLEIASLPVWRILSIENKANYRHYVRTEQQADELVVYLGGFHGPGKRRFLRLLRDYGRRHHAGYQFHHWGDLDYGGILIAQSLRDMVWPEVTTWRMEPEWLDTYSEYLESYPDPYRKKLEALLGNPRYEAYSALLEKLLQVGAVLEQEAFLV